jgi:UTP--glucose-1-phosphate uridylyltransferase
MPEVTKAIIPAAGLGPRFLPQTKAMPKEMLPIIDKPVIQYIVEEAVAAGITEVIIVTGTHKRAIEDHFDHQVGLQQELRAKGKDEKADQLEHIADMANFVYVRQKGAPGNGTPVLNASHLIDEEEPFLVLFADDMFQARVPRAQQLIDTYERIKKPVMSLMEVEGPAISKYGVINPGEALDERTYPIKQVVEKPQYDQAPSQLAAISGYVLDRTVLDALFRQSPEQDGEIYLTSAINHVAQHDEVYGRLLEGKWHDTGNRQRYLEAVVEMALEDPELATDFRAFLRSTIDGSGQ